MSARWTEKLFLIKAVDLFLHWYFFFRDSSGQPKYMWSRILLNAVSVIKNKEKRYDKHFFGTSNQDDKEISFSIKKMGFSGTLNKIETFKINQMISNKLQYVV